MWYIWEDLKNFFFWCAKVSAFLVVGFVVLHFALTAVGM